MAYDDHSSEELILRDRLAIDRTQLANERTLLAYVRTAFMLILAGGTAVKALPNDRLAIALGWALIGMGLLAAAFGVRRFMKFRARLRAVQ